jgi:hypothetical protein
MIDTSAALRAFLLDQPELVALTDVRIWAERDTPPPGYTPSDGAAICFKPRGGPPPDEEAAVLSPSYQFKLYGQVGGLTSPEASAGELYGVLFDVLNYASAYILKSAVLEAQRQTLREPDTGWVYALCFYKMQFLNEEA